MSMLLMMEHSVKVQFTFENTLLSLFSCVKESFLLTGEFCTSVAPRLLQCNYIIPSNPICKPYCTNDKVSIVVILTLSIFSTYFIVYEMSIMTNNVIHYLV